MVKKARKYRILRRAARILVAVVLIFLCIVLFIRSSWGQNIIVNKMTNYVSEKTNTKVEIERLFLTFSGNVFLEGLYLEDKKGDTLIFSKSLEANVPLSPLLFDNELQLKSIEWEGLKAYISRTEDSEKFNFDFLIDSFATEDTPNPEPETEAMQISIGTLDFKNFEIGYNDGFLGIESQLLLGELFFEADEIDLETMRFELVEVELTNTNITYKQTKAFVIEEPTESVPPYVSINNFQMEAVMVNYNSVPDGILADATIGECHLKLPKADLSKNDLQIDLLSLTNSVVSAQLLNNEIYQDSIVNTSNRTTFEWPDYSIQANEVILNNNKINYKAGTLETLVDKFNPDDIALTDFKLRTKFKYQPENVQLQLEKLSFLDKSGFQLRNLGFDVAVSKNNASLLKLNLQTNSSSLNGELGIQYPSIQSLLNSPANTTIKLELPNFNLALQDAFFFQPELVQNEYIEKAMQQPLTGNAIAEGTLKAFQIDDLKIDWGKNTNVVAKGSLGNLTQIDSLSFDFDAVQLKSIKKDILKFVPEKELGFNLPEVVLLRGSAEGNVKDISAHLRLETPEGNVQVVGNIKNQEEIQFDGNLKVDSLRLDKLLSNEQLGGVTFSVDASGGGNSLNTLNAELTSNFKQLEYNSYDFSNLKLDGKIVNGKGDINLNFKDDNLNLTATTAVILDTMNPKINLDLDLIGADLYALGITKEKIKLALEMNADFTGNSGAFRVNGAIENGVAVYDAKQYQMGVLHFNTAIDSMSTLVDIDSDFLMGNLQSNASPNAINNALTNQFKNYFRKEPEQRFLNDSVRVRLNAKLRPNPILTDVFFDGIEQLDSIVVVANFDATTKKLNAEMRLPLATYQGSSVDSLNVLITGDSTNLNFSAGLASLVADPIHIKKTYVEGVLKNQELLLDFLSVDSSEKVVHIASEVTFVNDTTRVHINPDNLILNREEWTIPKENSTAIAANFFGFENMKLSRNLQELSISNTVTGVQKEHLGITFDNFRLQTILGLFNPDEALASGMVRGDLIVENPFDAAGLVADFSINSLEVMQHPLGNLSLQATSTGSSKYDFNLALKDGGVDAHLKGDYAAATTGASLNLNLDLNRVDLKTIEGFTEGALKDAHGFISGNIDVSGTTTEPDYKGNLKFNGADFNVASLNSVFKISEETLKLDTDGIYFDKFEIVDFDGSNFTLDGSILTKNILNPDFDLRLNAERFRLVNSTKEDNELFYGIASLDADMTIKGNLELPKIEGNLRVREITDVTYVVPESQLDVQERDGVVIFVNRENPDAILTRNDQEEAPSLFKGMDVKAILEIAEDAEFQVVIDERTGDYLKVAGDAALNLNIEPNGRINLSGRYVLKSGHYETNLYNLVQRRFEINPGSTITWQGDPTDAKLDVTAIYEIETSASALMSSVTSGQDLSVTSKYRQVLPFLVYLNVDGELLEPELSFALDMPEDEQGALSGAVYTRVQQLNQQEAELNKQVFSLLALNRFYPDSGSDGSSGGTAALARDNVNKVLSGELNAFSDKVFGNSGVEVDFDLDSFTDYQGDSPQDRTQLNINAKKKLFDDRLIVTAGSAVDVEGSAQPGQKETPIIGNVSLEYLLSEDGRYRLKGFRKSEYQNIIDGQLIVTGVALIFNREFNTFSQLFNPLKKEAKKKEANKEENMTKVENKNKEPEN